MNRKTKPLILNLIKVENGYQIQTQTKQTSKNTSSKNLKNQNQKNSISRPSTRLARQRSILPEVPQPSQESSSSQNQPSQQQPPIVLPEQDNEYQIVRENPLPSKPANWFSFEQINQIERQSLPQFFNEKSYKTPQLYLKLRNMIVKLYDNNPNQYLTKVACRRILRGDANMIIRIHRFLQKEGVINFGLSLEGLRTFEPSFLNKTLQMQHLPQTVITEVPISDKTQLSTNIQTDNLTFSVVNKPFSRTFRVYCSNCKLMTGVVWYQAKNSQAPICFDCFQLISPQEKEEYQKVDIVQKINTLNNSKQSSKRTTWAIEQNVKLLQIMSQPYVSWQTLISSFEGKKTLQDIALQFLQFPITNFDPTTNSKIQPISYKYSQYVQIISKLHKKSDYGKGKEIEQLIKQKNMQNQTNSQKMINALLTNFSRRIDILKQLQDTIITGRQWIKNRLIRQNIKHRKNQETKIQKKQQQQMVEQQFNQNSLFHQSEQSQRGSNQILRLKEDDDSCGGLLNLNSDSPNEL